MLLREIVRKAEEQHKIEAETEGSERFVNNSEIADADIEESVEVVANASEVSEIVVETEEDKEHRITVIGKSLEIRKLEDELDKELKETFDVKDVEERIR